LSLEALAFPCEAGAGLALSGKEGQPLPLSTYQFSVIAQSSGNGRHFVSNLLM
jgi:hypothetical protein